MTQEFIDHYLFEPFMREKSMQRSDQEGTGLGMAIVARLVDKMHGSIHVESTVGKGSTFLLTLPFEKDLSCLQGKQEVIEEDILRDKTVLLVEDNALNMEIAEFLLKSLHATIVKAVNGKEAVDIFRKSSETLDYIFMDLMMPVMDGYEATRAIRSCSLSRAGSIPIFAMSANAYKEDIQKCIRCGMNGHISKPIFRESILRVISEYARSLETDGKEGRSCESIS